jgi:hypothetical protein
MEYLGSAVAARRSTRPLAMLLVASVILAALFLWWSDGVRRNADESVAAVVAEARERTRVGEARVLSTLAYASPMIWSESVPEDVRRDLRALVQASAAQSAADLGRVAARAGSIYVLPWQAPEAHAREQAVVLAGLLRERFELIAADARVLGEVLAEPAPTSLGDAPQVAGASLAGPLPAR